MPLTKGFLILVCVFMVFCFQPYLVSCGYGFTVYAVRSRRGLQLLGTGVNTSSQLGYHEVSRNSGGSSIMVCSPAVFVWGTPCTVLASPGPAFAAHCWPALFICTVKCCVWGVIFCPALFIYTVKCCVWGVICCLACLFYSQVLCAGCQADRLEILGPVAWRSHLTHCNSHLQSP